MVMVMLPSLALSPVGWLMLAVAVPLAGRLAYAPVMRWIVHGASMRTTIFVCTGAFCCTSAFWSVWLLSGRGSHLSWLQYCGLLLFVVWPAIYFGVSCAILKPTLSEGVGSRPAGKQATAAKATAAKAPKRRPRKG